MTGWLVVRYLHVLALASFVGGQIMLAAVVVPVERGEENRARLRAIARRFGWGTLAALLVLIATGTALAGHYDRWDDSTLQIKLAFVGAVAVLILAHMRMPTVHALDGAIFVVTLVILWLGVALAH
jgi:uncharacterized membrane protein